MVPYSISGLNCSPAASRYGSASACLALGELLTELDETLLDETLLDETGPSFMQRTGKYTSLLE
jgi:hypothetical protein